MNREKQLPIDDAVRLTREVASALDYAHRHKVIHRDIKPENVLLHDGSALVADFGIALAVSSAGATRMTERRKRLTLGGESLPQLLEPVHHHDHLRLIVARLDHRQVLAVGRDIVVRVKRMEHVVPAEAHLSRRDGEAAVARLTREAFRRR